MKPIILSLFQIVTLNFTLFIFAILACFLKTMSLRNRFVNVIFESKIIVFLYSRPSGGLYSFVRMEIEVTERCHNFHFVTFLDFIYWLPTLLEIRDKEFQLGSMLFQSCQTGNDFPSCAFSLLCRHWKKSGDRRSHLWSFKVFFGYNVS